MDTYSAVARMSLSTHISTEGGSTSYGVFDLSGSMIAKLVIAMLAFIVIAALVTIKHIFAPNLYRSRPGFLAASTLSVSVVAVVVCLGALLVTWWTEFPWQSNGDVGGLVVIASIFALVVYGLAAFAAFATLFDN